MLVTGPIQRGLRGEVVGGQRAGRGDDHVVVDDERGAGEAPRRERGEGARSAVRPSIAPSAPYGRVILSSPPMYGRSGSGMMTEPSRCWKFSTMAMSVRPTASPDPSACARTRLGLCRRAVLDARAPRLERHRVAARRDLPVRFWLGSHTSMSYVFAEANPMSPVHSSTVRCGNRGAGVRPRRCRPCFRVRPSTARASRTSPSPPCGTGAGG